MKKICLAILSAFILMPAWGAIELANNDTCMNTINSKTNAPFTLYCGLKSALHANEMCGDTHQWTSTITLNASVRVPYELTGDDRYVCCVDAQTKYGMLIAGNDKALCDGVMGQIRIYANCIENDGQWINGRCVERDKE